MREFIVSILIAILSIAFVSFCAWWVQPLTPFGYDLAYSEWFGLVVIIDLLKTKTKQD